jgi:hypothetical protein
MVLGLLIFVGSLALLPAHAVAAGCAGVCKGNDILVGEDEKNCYCQDRAEYAKCVGDAGRRLQSKLPNCEGVLSCLRRNDIHEEAGICAAALLLIPLAAGQPEAIPLTVGGSAVTCGWLTRDGLNKAKDCLNSTPSTCKLDALETHKADLKRCKEE